MNVRLLELHLSILFTAARAVLVTEDSTGSNVTYSTNWVSQVGACETCPWEVDPTQIFNETWAVGTPKPGSDQVSWVNIKFDGTGIDLFFVLPPPTLNTAAICDPNGCTTILSFSLNGQEASAVFVGTSDALDSSNNPTFQYNQSLYSIDGLPLGVHSVNVSAEASSVQQNVIMFNYYTFLTRSDKVPSLNSPTRTGSISISGTSTSSLPTTSAAVGTARITPKPRHRILPVIIAAVVGVLLIIAVATLVALIYCKRRRRKRSNSGDAPLQMEQKFGAHDQSPNETFESSHWPSTTLSPHLGPSDVDNSVSNISFTSSIPTQAASYSTAISPGGSSSNVPLLHQPSTTSPVSTPPVNPQPNTSPYELEVQESESREMQKLRNEYRTYEEQHRSAQAQKPSVSSQMTPREAQLEDQLAILRQEMDRIQADQRILMDQALRDHGQEGKEGLPAYE